MKAVKLGPASILLSGKRVVFIQKSPFKSSRFSKLATEQDEKESKEDRQKKHRANKKRKN